MNCGWDCHRAQATFGTFPEALASHVGPNADVFCMQQVRGGGGAYDVTPAYDVAVQKLTGARTGEPLTALDAVYEALTEQGDPSYWSAHFLTKGQAVLTVVLDASTDNDYGSSAWSFLLTA